MFRISVKDKMGMHLLRSNKDCCFKCKHCGKELEVTEKNTNNKIIKIPTCPECGRKMTFHYWLDELYTEDQYEELLKKD